MDNNIDNNNKFLKFMDKYYGHIAITFFVIFFGGFPFFLTILYEVDISIPYFGSLGLFILFYIGLSIWTKDFKYFGSIILAIVIGIITCGGTITVLSL